MKKAVLAIFVSAITVYSYGNDAGIRCENDIISIGETSSEVIAKLTRCGEVLDKQVIEKESGSTRKKKGAKRARKKKLVEMWYIRLNERGSLYCYPLTFEAGRLQDIGNWKRCD